MLDLAVGGNGGALSVLLGNGDGTFQASVDYPVTAGRGFLTIADFNGDGVQDVALVGGACMPVACSPAYVSLLFGNGDGSFKPEQTVLFAPDGGNGRQVQAADLNGDGKMDLVVSYQSGDSAIVVILLGNGDGSFQVLPATTFPQGLNQTPFAVAVGEFDGDGKPDLTVELVEEFRLYHGQGDGTFIFETSIPLRRVTASAMLAVDMNGDGKTDVAMANPLNGSAVVLLGNGNGTFQAPFSTGASSATGLVAGDFNGDGALDLAMSTPNGATIALGFGDGSFDAGDVKSTQGAYGPAVADFNGDTHLDVATSGFPQILLGNGDGTLNNPQSYPSSTWPFGVVAGDLNGDGKQDLAALRNPCDCNGAISVLLGNGDGTFQAPVDYETGPGPRNIAAGDFNKDGKMDFVVANAGNGSGNSVSVLLGNGDGTLQPKVDYATPLFPIMVAVADFNGDGNLDLAVLASLTISVMLGNGDGTFQPAVNVGPADGFLVAGDFNGDGKVDLVYDAAGTSPAQTELVIAPGNGDGTFQAPILLLQDPKGSGNLIPLVGDLNGDGKLDLLWANRRRP